MDLRSIVVPIASARAWPEAITPPPDRRHRWRLTSEGKRRWFRCDACGKRRSVTSLVSVLGDKLVKAERSMSDYLNAHLFGRA